MKDLVKPISKNRQRSRSNVEKNRVSIEAPGRDEKFLDIQGELPEKPSDGHGALSEEFSDGHGALSEKSSDGHGAVEGTDVEPSTERPPKLERDVRSTGLFLRRGGEDGQEKKKIEGIRMEVKDLLKPMPKAIDAPGAMKDADRHGLEHSPKRCSSAPCVRRPGMATGTLLSALTANLNMLTERSRLENSLCPLQPADGKWEIITSVMDSGATVPVLMPTAGKEYPVQESEASRAGVEYEIANGDTLANLGEKMMAVLTKEGTLRGYKSQVANVSKNLQSVRALLSSGHAVCFGLGENGEDHVVVNRLSGEINFLRDDGVNYLQDLMVVPPDQIEQVAQQIADPANQDFGRQGS